MSKTIANPDRNVEGQLTPVVVRQYQAVKGMTLKCVIASQEGADGVFTKDKQYEVVHGWKDDPEGDQIPPVGFDEADVLDDNGQLVRVILDPHNEVAAHAGLFEIVSNTAAKAAMKAQDAAQ